MQIVSKGWINLTKEKYSIYYRVDDEDGKQGE